MKIAPCCIRRLWLLLVAIGNCRAYSSTLARLMDRHTQGKVVGFAHNNDSSSRSGCVPRICALRAPLDVVLARRRGVRPRGPHSPLFSRAGGEASPRDVTALAATSTTNDSTSPPLIKEKFSKRVWVARMAVLWGIFAAGYQCARWRGATMSANSRGSWRVFLLRLMVVLLLTRDVWRAIPAWAKPGLVTRAVADTKRLLGGSSATQDDGNLKTTMSAHENKDNMTDLTTLTSKINKMFETAERRLPEEEFGNVNVQASLLALLNLLEHYKEQHAHLRDDEYASCAIGTVGEDATKNNIVTAELADWMDLADAAYDELPDGQTLQDYLEERGYQLLKHNTNVLPGTLGHYVALDKNSATALIGIKGTSNLEDMITDMIGAATEYTLDGPFWSNEAKKNNTTTKIQAHEGIFLSSRRLANDLMPLVERLLLPQRYKIVVVGHSLGAAASALFTILLQSRLPELQGRIQVYAFASPPSLDLVSARACRNFCTTIVNNADAIPRCNVGPVLVTMQVLKAVQDRLLSKMRNESSKEDAPKKLSIVDMVWQYWRASLRRKRRLKNRGVDSENDEPFMTPQELSQSYDKALDTVGFNDDDTDQLYVPGNVILMYDLWQEESNFLKRRDSDEKSGELEYDYSADRAIMTEPTAKVLRYLDFDKRMVEDHMAPSYKNSLRALADACL